MRIIIIMMIVMGIVGTVIIKVRKTRPRHRLRVPWKELAFSFRVAAKALQDLRGVFICGGTALERRYDSIFSSSPTVKYTAVGLMRERFRRQESGNSVRELERVGPCVPITFLTAAFPDLGVL